MSDSASIGGGSRMPARTTQTTRVTTALLTAIRSGRYATGAMLPPELALCRQFDVSRITVRAALRELELRGMLSRRPGIGTRVESQAGRERFVHAADSVEDFLQSLAELTYRQLSSKRLQADALLAQELHVAEGCKLLRIEALRQDSTGVPVCYSIHHVPVAHAGEVRKMDGRNGSLATRVAAAAGDEVAETRQVIDAHNLSVAEARLLKARPRDAALLTRRWYLSSSGTLLVQSVSLFPKGRYSYAMRMRRERAGR